MRVTTAKLVRDGVVLAETQTVAGRLAIEPPRYVGLTDGTYKIIVSTREVDGKAPPRALFEELLQAYEDGALALHDGKEPERYKEWAEELVQRCKEALK